jgi:hypothetical protein
MGEAGRPHWAHNPEIVGSNPTPAFVFLRSIAQLGRAPALGAGGRRFESSCSDLSRPCDGVENAELDLVELEVTEVSARTAQSSFGRVAQFGRAPLSRSGGRWFEPNSVHFRAPIQWALQAMRRFESFLARFDGPIAQLVEQQTIYLSKNSRLTPRARENFLLVDSGK